MHARALLLLDAGEHEPKLLVEKVAEAVGMTTQSLEHLKKRFVEEGISAAIERKERLTPPREIQFGGEFEAKLIGLFVDRFDARILISTFVTLLGIGAYLTSFSSSVVQASIFFCLARIGHPACWATIVGPLNNSAEKISCKSI